MICANSLYLHHSSCGRWDARVSAWQVRQVAVVLHLSSSNTPARFLTGFEADDVMATLARWCHSRLMNVVIVSQDKDMLQLVKPGLFAAWVHRFRSILQ
jgi:hypothetical protein